MCPQKKEDTVKALNDMFFQFFMEVQDMLVSGTFSRERVANAVLSVRKKMGC